MFKNWQTIFTSDCEVIRISKSNFVYPIFKNGRSSLKEYARQNNLLCLKNNEISDTEEIKIFLRDPLERFVSGVHTAIELENRKTKVNVLEFMSDVEKFKIYDRHFMPQTFWLYHLFKYFKGKVNLQPVKNLFNLIPNRDKPGIPTLQLERKEKILTLEHKPYTDIDYKLVKKYMNTSTDLETIIRDLKK